MAIPFIDLAAQQARLQPSLNDAIARVLAHGQYIMGPEVKELESRLSAFCGAKRTITCANGTDALLLALKAFGLGPGDAVFTPSFTFAATAEVVALANAEAVFVDVLPDTFNMDPNSLKRCIVAARDAGLKPAAVIVVDLFGLPAEYDTLLAIARESDLKVICDSAQGFGAVYRGKVTGSIGDVATTSFFPAKPLGCYGDGGAVFTDDEETASLIDSFRWHGRGEHNYAHDRVGLNSRLDTLQAAILLEKLSVYVSEIEARQLVAQRYTNALSNRYETPYVPDGLTSVWAQYTLKMANAKERSNLQDRARSAGVPTAVYYPTPLHTQKAYSHCLRDPNGLRVSDDLSSRVISLPMHAYLDQATQDRILTAISE